MSSNSPHNINQNILSTNDQNMRQSLQISDGGEWKAMSKPMNIKRSSKIQIAGAEESYTRNIHISKTIEY